MARAARSFAIAALVGVALGAGGLAALADPSRGGFQPDPPPRASRTQWVFELSARGGLLGIERVKQVTLDKPAESPRVVGRYALELYIGPELLDRVRFNVPLMGGEATVGNRNHLPKPRFNQVTAQLNVRIADNPRAAYLLMVDRQTGDTQKLFWPPESDGTVVLWKNMLSDASPGDFPEGGVRAVGIRDGGTPEAGIADSGRD